VGLCDWIESFELDSGIGSGELPFDFRLRLVAVALPSVDFVSEFVSIRDSAVETLASKDSQFDLRHVQPTSVFRCVVNFEFVDQAAGFFGREGRVERRRFVSVEVVLNEHDFLRVGVHHVNQMAYGVGVVDCGALVRHEGFAASFQRSVQHEDVGDAVADVLVVDDPRWMAWPGFNRYCHMIHQLFAGLVEANQWPSRVGRSLVDVQSLLHLADKFGIGLGRDDVLRYAPRLKLIF